MDETLAPYFYKEKNEKRMPIKQLFNTQADITVKEEEQTLAITIASLSAPRYNEAIKKICEVLNNLRQVRSSELVKKNI
jgi:hypothetical protein